MSDELTTTVPLPAPARTHRVGPLLRVRHGMRHTHNWLQLVRFGAVGASGYVVNLAVFAVCVLGQLGFRSAILDRSYAGRDYARKLQSFCPTNESGVPAMIAIACASTFMTPASTSTTSTT